MNRVSLMLPDAPVVDPQFKVMVDDQQAGVVVHDAVSNRWLYYKIGIDTPWPIKTHSVFILLFHLEKMYSAPDKTFHRGDWVEVIASPGDLMDFDIPMEQANLVSGTKVVVLHQAKGAGHVYCSSLEDGVEDWYYQRKHLRPVIIEETS